LVAAYLIPVHVLCGWCRVLTKREAWTAFRQGLTTVLKAFDDIPIKVPASSQVPLSSSKGSSSTSSKAADKQPKAAAALAPNGLAGDGRGVGSSGESAVVTYLSSHTLFNLQMRDGLFRRGFLVQVGRSRHGG
jgi:hypothetical protein